MSKKIAHYFVVGAVVVLTTVSAASAEYFSTSFTSAEGYANNQFINGVNGWQGGDRFRSVSWWGSDAEGWSAYRDASTSFGANYHTLTTDGTPVSNPFEVSFDITLSLADVGAFNQAGLYLSHTADDAGRWNTGPVTLIRDPNDNGIKIGYFDNTDTLVYAGGDLSGMMYTDYFYTFTQSVDPENRMYDLLVTQTNKNTEVTVELLNVTDISFRGGTHTSLMRMEFGGLNSSAASGNNRIYIDNIRVVPEPGSMLLLGIGALLVVGHRSRK